MKGAKFPKTFPNQTFKMGQLFVLGFPERAFDSRVWFFEHLGRDGLKFVRQSDLGLCYVVNSVC